MTNTFSFLLHHTPLLIIVNNWRKRLLPLTESSGEHFSLCVKQLNRKLILNTASLKALGKGRSVYQTRSSRSGSWFIVRLFRARSMLLLSRATWQMTRACLVSREATSSNCSRWMGSRKVRHCWSHFPRKKRFTSYYGAGNVSLNIKVPYKHCTDNAIALYYRSFFYYCYFKRLLLFFALNHSASL